MNDAQLVYTRYKPSSSTPIWVYWRKFIAYVRIYILFYKSSKGERICCKFLVLTCVYISVVLELECPNNS